MRNTRGSPGALGSEITVPLRCSAPPSSRLRPQMVNVPSAVNDTGFFSAKAESNLTPGTSKSNVHFSGSLFLLVAHC